MIVFALSTQNKVVLGLVALAWIVFSLVVSMVLPRSRPDFPGKNLGAFLGVAAVFFVAMLFAVFVFGKEAKSEGEAAPEAPAVTETSGAATTTAPTETGGGGTADLAAGKAVFAKASCGGCHVLKAAGGKGAVGPNLDELKPDQATVMHQVENGGGAMPAYKGVLTDQEIAAVAAYVSQVAGSS